ncbi:sequestosome-1-like isoform X2 [Oculina patagonica]
MALSVKAYINPDTNQQEIRRFAIDEGASANYGYLRQKIEQVFPSVRGKAFKLFWKDEDNEMITFSSDDELVEALGSFNGDVFRVYVKADDQDATFDGETDGSEQTGPEHPGVVCDSCDKHIFGVRFKCVVCPNYDLCVTCETKGAHKEHEMLRIATPRSPEHNWFHGFNPFAFGHPPPHHPPHGPPPHHPPHGPHGGFPPFDFGRGFGPWGRGCGRRGGGGRGRCPKGRRCNNGGKKCDRHTAEATGNPGEVPVGPPFLHAVGESIASFLGPFGVEVHTYASTEPDCCQGKCKEGEGAKSSEATAQAGPSGESTGPLANDDMEESAPETSNEETSEMDVQPPEEFVLVDEKTAASGTVDDEVPTDPLEVAIAKMRAMGFEDDSDSGWLKQLITAKGYDLNKVLDAMQFEGNH